MVIFHGYVKSPDWYMEKSSHVPKHRPDLYINPPIWTIQIPEKRFTEEVLRIRRDLRKLETVPGPFWPFFSIWGVDAI
jgi:hypothetical protein